MAVLTQKNQPIPETHAESSRSLGMESKIDRLLDGVERLLLHVANHIPPGTVQVDDLKNLVAEIRQERTGLADDIRFASAREAGEPG